MSSLLYASCDATSARVEKAGSRLDAKIVVVSTIPGWADSEPAFSTRAEVASQDAYSNELIYGGSKARLARSDGEVMSSRKPDFEKRPPAGPARRSPTHDISPAAGQTRQISWRLRLLIGRPTAADSRLGAGGLRAKIIWLAALADPNTLTD